VQVRLRMQHHNQDDGSSSKVVQIELYEVGYKMVG